MKEQGRVVCAENDDVVENRREGKSVKGAQAKEKAVWKGNEYWPLLLHSIGQRMTKLTFQSQALLSAMERERIAREVLGEKRKNIEQQ